MDRAVATALLVAALVGPSPVAAAPDGAVVPVEERPFLRGMVVSCPRWGQVWGSAEMDRALAELAGLRVRWVAIHPYAGVRRDGSLRWRPAAETGYLDGAAQRVRSAGLGLFWKPHLAYWGSFEWRGEIEFGADEAAWSRFFAGYRTFIVDQARFAEAAGAGIFALGVELERTTHRPEWPAIVAEVRRVYSGQLTYAANWDAVDRVPFWGALDLVAVHAYYPLAAGEDPDRETLWRGWDAPLAALQRLSSELGGKRVLFAEIGYNRSARAAREPWDYQVEDSAANRELRRRLIEVALERLEAEPLVAGVFWWKWIPGGRERNFSMRDAEAREALARLWGRSG